MAGAIYPVHVGWPRAPVFRYTFLFCRACTICPCVHMRDHRMRGTSCWSPFLAFCLPPVSWPSHSLVLFGTFVVVPCRFLLLSLCLILDGVSFPCADVGRGYVFGGVSRLGFVVRHHCVWLAQHTVHIVCLVLGSSTWLTSSSRLLAGCSSGLSGSASICSASARMTGPCASSCAK